jgi:indole-3-acetate monooxygenase
MGDTGDMGDAVARARSLQPLIRDAATDAEAQRRLPQHVAKAMAQAGLYRIAAPAVYQGSDTSPRTQIEVIEAVAEADGAAGWNLMIGIEAIGLMALTFPGGVDLFADPLSILASSTAAIGEAEKVDGGYRVNGTWQFVSGVHNSDFFGGLVHRHRDGEDIGGRTPVYAVLPRDEIEILDTWHVGGLRGSGSHDVAVVDRFVPDERIAVPDRPWLERLRAESPLTRLPLSVRLAYNKVAVALGVARAAVDEFTDLAQGKTPRFGSVRLRERPFAQRAVATAEVRLRAARALVMELVEEIWSVVLEGAEVAERQRALFQIASSDAAIACNDAVATVAQAAGTTANFLASPLERRVRDVRVVGQHVTVAPHLIEDGGRILLGLPAESFILGRLPAPGAGSPAFPPAPLPTAPSLSDPSPSEPVRSETFPGGM